jgi:hypothetical protein
MIETSWADDKLDRKGEAERLLEYVNNRIKHRRLRNENASLTINIDASWGQGKSYFLKNIEKDLKRSGNVVAIINAWESDFSDNPMLTVVSELENSFRELFNKDRSLKSIWEKTKKVGGATAISLTRSTTIAMARKFLGKEFENTIDEVTSNWNKENLPKGSSKIVGTVAVETAEAVVEKLSDSAMSRLLAAHRREEKSIQNFKFNLKKLADHLFKKNNSLIFIVIDEMDRCRPIYSIEMLEIVKHIFSIENIVFLIATDTEQLCASLKIVYGDEFDSKNYLNRFFERSYKLKNPNRKDLIGSLINKYGINKERLFCGNLTDPESYISELCQHVGISIREIEQCMEILFDFSITLPENQKIHLMHLWPIILTIHIQREKTSIDTIDAVVAKKMDRKNGSYVNITQAKIDAIYNKYANMTVVDIFESEKDYYIYYSIRDQIEADLRSIYNKPITRDNKNRHPIAHYQEMVEFLNRLSI